MRPFLRSSARVARFSRPPRYSPRIAAGTSPNWCAFKLPSARFQSTQPPGRPNDPEGNKENGKPDRNERNLPGAEQDAPAEDPHPMAPGRTPLTPEDEAILQRMMNDMKQMEGVFGESDLKSVQNLIERWKKEGADKDLQEFLRLSKEGKPSISATVKLVRSIMSMQFDPEPPAEEQSDISSLSSVEDIHQALDEKIKQLGSRIERNLAAGVLTETSEMVKQKVVEITQEIQELDKAEPDRTKHDPTKLLEINSRLAALSDMLGLYQNRVRRAARSRQTKGPAQEGENKEDGGLFGGFPSFQGGKGIKLDLNTIVTTAIVTWIVGSLMWPSQNSKEITWQEFRTSLLEKGLVEKIVVTNSHYAKIYLRKEDVAAVMPDSPAAHGNFYYYFSIASIEAFERRLDEAQRIMNIPTPERIPVAFQEEIPWLNTLISFGPSVLFMGLIFALTRRAASGGGQSGLFGIGRSRAKQFNHESAVKVKFADVAGMDEAKLEIMEFVSFLKEPSIYQRLGAKIPRGAILSGPPGTGKTLLAKATAGESAVPFYSVSGSEFVEMFVGVGPSRVRDLFATARKNTPCIIFIDEIDAIGRARSSKSFGGGNDERESTLNQILTEMDGFNTSEQVVVMAGTNRPDILDKALLRPGRFDRHIMIDSPTMKGRAQIFAVHLKKIVTKEDTVHLRGRLAALTPGFSGADIANCVNEAALIAARGKAESVALTHFEQAIERVVGGLERKSLVLSPEEKKVVAYHEAGHAVCGWYFRYADPLLKVSIIPRGSGALGYAQYLPEGDTYLMNALQLMDRMAMALGGRVSEELHFETVTSGASDDFKKVTAMATAMVTRFGMSRKIGYLSFDENQEQLHKPFSEETAKSIDGEVRRIVEDAYKQCNDLLTAKKAEIGIVAEELLKKEVLSRDDMIRLLGARPFPEKGEFHKYFGTPRPEAAEGDAPAPDPPLVVPPTDGPTPSPVLFKRE